MKLEKKQTHCLISLVCCFGLSSCVPPEGNHASNSRSKDDLSIYRVTNDQAGHEWVKTEQFLVPIGSVVIIEGLEFAPGISALTPRQKLIVQQVFNALEEITENTVNDTNAARVAEFKKMEFAVIGYGDEPGRSETNAGLAAERANAVRDWLVNLGTPPWRLKTSRPQTLSQKKLKPATQPASRAGRVEFVRMR